MSIQKDPIAEAERYLRNADKLLKENCKVDDLGNYSDEKYVKMAGDTAWKSVLEALEPLHPPIKKHSRKSVDTYREIFKGRYKKYMNVYNNVYSQLHLSMGYDGVTDTKLKKVAWSNAKTLIDWANDRAKKQKEGV